MHGHGADQEERAASAVQRVGHDRAEGRPGCRTESVAGIVLSGKGTYNVEVRFSRASGDGPICHTMQPSGLRAHTGLEVDHNGGIVLVAT